VRLALKTAFLKTRLSRLKAEAKLSPAELRKLDIVRLSASSNETIEAVLKTYEAREPVIHVGQYGTIKGMSASEIAKEVRLSNLESETRSNMTFFKTGVKMSDPQQTNKIDKVEKEVEMAGDQESLWGEIVKAIKENDDDGAKKLFIRACKMISGDVSMDDGSMAELMGAYASLESNYESVVQLTRAQNGIKL